MSASAVSAIIIDSGSLNTKAGFAMDDMPKAVFRTDVGQPKLRALGIGMGLKDIYVGDEVGAMRGIIEARRPIERGVIKDFEDMEKVWHHTFYTELRVPPEDFSVLVTEIPLNAKPIREKITEIMFETFNVPAMYVGIQEALSLYSTGRTTGVAIDFGAGKANVVPVFEGYCLQNAIEHFPLAGVDITSYFNTLLSESGYSFTSIVEFDIVRRIKEKVCYVSLDYDKDMDISLTNSKKLEKTYKLPDGDVIIVRNAHFRATEPIFQPKMAKLDCKSLPECVNNTIMKCDDDIKIDLYNNIIMTGASSLFPNIEERLEQELKKIYANDDSPPSIAVTALSDRKYGSWIGGSILASLSGFQKMWIERYDYEDLGPSIVHRKCF